jgi:hypothetical protein
MLCKLIGKLWVKRVDIPNHAKKATHHPSAQRYRSKVFHSISELKRAKSAAPLAKRATFKNDSPTNSKIAVKLNTKSKKIICFRVIVAFGASP